jgi:hypothetical protein
VAQISKAARTALYGRLSARFNDIFAAIAPGYGVQPFVIDFASAPDSANFFYGQIDPNDIEDTTPYTLPLMTLYTVQSVNQHRQKPANFSGAVVLGTDVVLSFLKSAARQDFESIADAVEEAMNTISNELALQGVVVDVSMARGPVKRGQKNWWQLLRFNWRFEVLA